MLIKLLKHEFRATGRIMLPMYLVLLATAIGSNLSGRWMIGSSHTVINTLGVLIVTAFGIAIFGACVLAFVLMIQRFYKNLLQDEGYLMFTLPVSVHQHIWAKLIVSAVWFIATVLVIIAAGLIVAYDVRFLRGFFEFLGEILSGLRLLKINEALNGTVFLVEFLALIFLSLVAFSLQFYAALAAGHSFPSHKMVLSVGCFFLFQFVVQFLGSLLLIGLSNVDFISPFRAFEQYFDVHAAAAIHAALVILIVLVVIYGAIFYGVTIFFLKRRLNLE